jgi:hypothetical protein
MGQAEPETERGDARHEQPDVANPLVRPVGDREAGERISLPPGGHEVVQLARRDPAHR